MNIADPGAPNMVGQVTDMNRKELVRIVVLLDVSDDYETTVHIAQRLTNVANTCRVAFERHEVVDALSELLNTGLANVYRLSPYAPVEKIVGIPSASEFDDDYTHFYITDEGKMEIDRMRRGAWPFDDDGNFRQEFCPDGKA